MPSFANEHEIRKYSKSFRILGGDANPNPATFICKLLNVLLLLLY